MAGNGRDAHVARRGWMYCGTFLRGNNNETKPGSGTRQDEQGQTEHNASENETQGKRRDMLIPTMEDNKKQPGDNPNASSNTCQLAVFPARKETKKPKRDANNQMRNIHNCGDFKFGRWEGEEKERGQCGVSKRLLGDGRGRRLGRLPRQLSASLIFSSNSCFLPLLSSFIRG